MFVYNYKLGQVLLEINRFVFSNVIQNKMSTTVLGFTLFYLATLGAKELTEGD